MTTPADRAAYLDLLSPADYRGSYVVIATFALDGPARCSGLEVRRCWCGLANSDATQQFYEVVWPLRAVVLRAARIQTGNTADADDLAQETLLKAFSAIDSFRGGTDARAWLFTILRNMRIDRLRTAAGCEKHVRLDELPADLEAAAPTIERNHERVWSDPGEILSGFSDAQVIAALQEVSEDLRWTLLLVDVEGLNHSEAARILGVPIGTVKSRVHRGHAGLRQALLPLARERRFLRE